MWLNFKALLGQAPWTREVFAILGGRLGSDDDFTPDEAAVLWNVLLSEVKYMLSSGGAVDLDLLT